MKKFKVVIPEKRVEVVMVEWEIKAESEETIKEMLEKSTFSDIAEYIDTKESRWGFDVDEIYYKEAKIEEVEDEKV